ncbi:hypothetical protein Ac2012v2_002314 [Leucoagaricus gongylophorus]
MTSGSTTSAAIHEHILNHPSSNSSFIPNLLYPKSYNAMGTKGRSTPRVVCCAIPISKSTGKVLVVQSRKRKDRWVLPKGGWEPSDVQLEAAASREAFEEAGVRGPISRYLVTIPTPSSTYHFYEMDIVGLEQDWPERKERSRELVDYAEAIRRLEWKTELAQALKLSSIAPRR